MSIIFYLFACPSADPQSSADFGKRTTLALTDLSCPKIRRLYSAAREANLIYKTCLSGECDDMCYLFRPCHFDWTHQREYHSRTDCALRGGSGSLTDSTDPPATSVAARRCCGFIPLTRAKRQLPVLDC